nr:MAG TPA: hypothetical protein [Bacteriophage sp.]
MKRIHIYYTKKTNFFQYGNIRKEFFNEFIRIV